MLLKHKIRKYALLLIVLSLVFQVIPGTFENVECLDKHTPKSSIIFSASDVHTDIAFFTMDGRKTTFYLMAAEGYDSLIKHICIDNVSGINSIYHKAPTDYRKVIKKTILHYFHGSKYKDESLFI